MNVIEVIAKYRINTGIKVKDTGRIWKENPLGEGFLKKN